MEARILPKVASGARKFVEHVSKICGPGKVIAPRMLLKITAMNSSLKLVLDSEISYDDLGTYDDKTNRWNPPANLSKAAKMAFFFFEYIDATFTCLAAANVRDVMPWPLNIIVPRPSSFAKFFKLAGDRDALWKDVLREHRQTLVPGQPRDWVDEILDPTRKIKLKDEEIVGLLMDTVIATSDTFIAFIEWLLAKVAELPDEQKKLQAELDKVAPDRLVDAKDIHDCHYFVAFMKEIFRMYPLTPINPPRRAIEDETLGGYDVPKDTWVFQHWGVMGKLEDQWVEPEVFRPSRFLEEAKDIGNVAMKSVTNPKASSPLNIFAFGRRHCPGYRLGPAIAFVQAAMMIQCFEWKLHEDSDLAANPRLIVFPKSFKAFATYRLKKPLEELFLKEPDNSGAFLSTN
jgi:cytochrome P450